MSEFLEKLKENKILIIICAGLLLIIIGFIFGFCSGYMEREYTPALSETINILQDPVILSLIDSDIGGQETVNWLLTMNFQFMNQDNSFVDHSNDLDLMYWIEGGKTIHDINDNLNYLLKNRYSQIYPSLVAYALGFYGDANSIPLLIGTLKTGGLNLRINSAAALGKLKAKAALKDLCVGALEDSDVNVRANCIAALGEIGDPNSLPTLEKAVNDKNEFVASSAKDAIKEIKNHVDNKETIK